MVKIKFYHLTKNLTIDKEKVDFLISKLPPRFYFFAPIQYLDVRDKLAKIFKEKGKKIIDKRLPHCFYENQLLGCSINDHNKFDLPIIVIGDGLFHIKSFNTSMNDVYLLTPDLNLQKIEAMTHRKDLEEEIKRANKIGIIVSTKPGQFMGNENISKVVKRIKEMGKECFVFVGDNISMNTLIDYKFIDLWINTACPRLIDDAIEKGINLININSFSFLWHLETQ